MRRRGSPEVTCCSTCDSPAAAIVTHLLAILTHLLQACLIHVKVQL